MYQTPGLVKGTIENSGEWQDWWHYMIMFKVLMQHEEATDDERVIPFISKFLRYMRAHIEDQPLDRRAMESTDPT
jgi:hypothetical protein